MFVDVIADEPYPQRIGTDWHWLLQIDCLKMLLVQMLSVFEQGYEGHEAREWKRILLKFVFVFWWSYIFWLRLWITLLLFYPLCLWLEFGAITISNIALILKGVLTTKKTSKYFIVNGSLIVVITKWKIIAKHKKQRNKIVIIPMHYHHLQISRTKKTQVGYCSF